MPGGNPTINLSRPNLQSFLAIKRKSHEQWLLDNGITTQLLLEAFLKEETWQVSAELANHFSDLLRPLYVPAIIVSQPPVIQPVDIQPAITVAQEPVAVVEIKPEVVVELEVPIVPEEQKIDVVVSVAEPVTSVSDAVVVIAEEGSGVSAFKPDYSNKDRKRSR